MYESRGRETSHLLPTPPLASFSIDLDHFAGATGAGPHLLGAHGALHAAPLQELKALPGTHVTTPAREQIANGVGRLAGLP